MTHQLSEFCELYKSSKKHWYILPRALYFNPKNLQEFHRVLSFFKKMQYVKVKDLPSRQFDFFSKLDPEDTILREWTTKTKNEIQRQMISEGIIKPKAKERQTLQDHLANIRNHINLFKKLGLAYFNKQHHIFISQAGEKFLAAGLNQLGEVLENQILKLQFTNPSLEKKGINPYQGFKLFPYLFTLKLLLSLTRKYIDVREFTLFVTPLCKDNQIDKARTLIERYRSLPPRDKGKVAKHARLTTPHTANTSVTLGLFGLTPTLRFEKNRLTVVDAKRAKYLVNAVYPKMKFVDYAKFEDWFKYMGDTRFEVPNREIMEYYVDLGQKGKAEEVIGFTDDIGEQQSLKETLEELFREKLVEDALENNPAALEKGLRLAPSGRQFVTDVSNIDLLMQDEEGNYIVVELKKGKTEDDVVGQTLRYMGWIREHISKTRIVRGIIVVAKGEISNKLEMAIKGLQTAQHLIKLKEIPITIDDIRDHAVLN
jgi:hypothetical protein